MASSLFKKLIASVAMFVGAVSFASAATVLDVADGFSSTGIKNYTFSITTPGEYKATLTDFSFPESFAFLSTGIYKNPTLLGSVTGSGSFTFNASAAGTYTALVFGKPGANTGFSSFGLTVAAVPEPETYALMLAGLGVVGVVARRRRSTSQAIAA